MGVKVLGGGGVQRAIGGPFFPMIGTAALPGGALYDAPNVPSTIAAVALPIDILSAVPFVVGSGVGAVSAIGVNHTVNGGAGSVARLGLWRSDPVSRRPTTLLFDSGSFATDAGASTVPRMFAVPNVPVSPGELLWVSYLAGVAAPTITVTYNLAAGTNSAGAIFGEVPASGNIQWGWTVAFPFAALPVTFPAGAVPGVTAGANTPVLKVRFA